MQTILAVDEEERNLMRIEQILSAYYDVVAVNSEAMALKFLKQRIPDLVLMGSSAREGNSLQSCIELIRRIEGEKIPVAYLAKSYEAVTLCCQIREMLSQDETGNKRGEETTFLPVIRNDKIEEVAVNLIESVEIYKQISIVRLEYQELQTKLSMDYLIKKLGDSFVAVGEGLLVNKKWIQRVTEGILYMKTGRQYVLPKEKREKIAARLRKIIAANALHNERHIL